MTTTQCRKTAMHPLDIIAELDVYCKFNLEHKFIRGTDVWTHTISSSIYFSDFSQSKYPCNVVYCKGNSEDYQMHIIQYILCCVMILLFPPVSWIYGLIYWVYNGCKIPSFSLADIAICECWDDNTTMEESLKEIAVLRQMLEDFQLKNQA